MNLIKFHNIAAYAHLSLFCFEMYKWIWASSALDTIFIYSTINLDVNNLSCVEDIILTIVFLPENSC